jgi:hypothetical protein
MIALRRSLYGLSTLAAVWAVVVAATGGLELGLGPLRLSSRTPTNPLLVALLAAGAAVALLPAGQRRAVLVADWMWLSRLITRHSRVTSHIAAGGLVLIVVALGIREGTFVASGSDSFGYVSEAHMWASGSTEIDVPLMRELDTELPPEAFAPLAYRPSPRPGAIVPIVAPGLPLLMALFESIGGSDAAYYVVSMLAGLAIAATYAVGRRLAGDAAGIAAAILLATSPSFLYQITSPPMSDVPATAWWALALALLPARSRGAIAGAGIAAGMAILTRPNLAPLAAILIAFLVWRRANSQPPTPDSQELPISKTFGKWELGAGSSHALWFMAGVAPACLAIAALNQYWYGGPLDSGYGPLDALFRGEYLVPNLQRYPVWLVDSQTPIVALAFVGPFLAASRPLAITLLAFALAVFACYAFYAPFDAWWFLRFLLPAYPALLALTGAAVVKLAGRLPAGLRGLTASAAIALVAWHGIGFAVARGTFRTDGELRYATVGRYVADHVPSGAVLFAMLHGGSAWHYSGRPTIRYDVVPPDRLDRVVEQMRRRGRATYFVVEEWELARVRERFAGARATRMLDEQPIALLPGPTRIYDVGIGDPR